MREVVKEEFKFGFEKEFEPAFDTMNEKLDIMQTKLDKAFTMRWTSGEAGECDRNQAWNQPLTCERLGIILSLQLIFQRQQRSQDLIILPRTVSE